MESPAPTVLTAGATLNAVNAISNTDQQHFTRSQVAYLIALAYETGRLHAASEEMAETFACWREHAEPRATRAERIRGRIDEMTAAAEAQRERPKPWPNLDVDWPPVAQPGGSGLRVAA